MAITLVLALLLGIAGGSAGAAVVIASISGATTTQGIDGANGLDGATGASGSPGLKGDSGTPGTDGMSGTNGNSGSAGINGTNGTDGPPGPAGAQGPMGPPGPAGTSASAIWAEALGTPQVVADDDTIIFQSALSTTSEVTHQTDGLEVTEAGFYELSYSVRPTPGLTSTGSLAKAVTPSFVLNLNGSPLETTRVYRPMLDVNVALILTLRTLIDGATVEHSGYQYLTAGTRVSLQAAGNDGKTTNLSASLRIQKLS